MIRFADVTFRYNTAAAPVLDRVDFEVPEGELWAVVGLSGTGKSTLLRAVNGLVPHFSGGHFSGEVCVDGRSTRTCRPRDLADIVGMVGQSPADGFVTDTVEDELAYAMENLGVPPAAMRRRVEDTLDLLGLHDLRTRSLRDLSGGQQQRVAIASVLTAAPRILVLDEPTSALDPAAAEEVLASLSRLVDDLGVSVLMAEHRLERVLPFADRIVLVPGGSRPVVVGEPSEVMATSPVAPPLIHLGQAAGWSPLPLTVRDARRVAGPLRERLRDKARTRVPALPDAAAAPVAEVAGLTASYGTVVALQDVTLNVYPGEIVALMGRNGSGKSTLLAHLAGLRAPRHGRVRVAGDAPHRLAPKQLIRRVGLVPQNPAQLLYSLTVADECRTTDHDDGLSAGTTAACLERVLPGVPADSHPNDLSEGQRLALALAVVLASGPQVVALDEPTRGLDYAAKQRLGAILRDLARQGTAIVVATHDVELVAQLADRAVVLADGEVVADGPAREVVCHSPVFAPQVAKVLAPDPWLTVDEVEEALAVAAP
ncbi:MAG: ATP-binding cassette domain-containing protein [Acidimicrobiaceae bacterium]|nr:ATP-binding cassette domain-containing protein [Acidimicrobiaceae bacterium]